MLNRLGTCKARTEGRQHRSSSSHSSERHRAPTGLPAWHLLRCSTIRVAHLLALRGILESLPCSGSCYLQPIQCVIQAVDKQLVTVIHVLQGLGCLCRGALQ